MTPTDEMFSKTTCFLGNVGSGVKVFCETVGLGLEGAVEAWDLSADDVLPSPFVLLGTSALTKTTDPDWLHAMQVRERQLCTSVDVDGVLFLIWRRKWVQQSPTLDSNAVHHSLTISAALSSITTTSIPLFELFRLLKRGRENFRRDFVTTMVSFDQCCCVVKMAINPSLSMTENMIQLVTCVRVGYKPATKR